MACTRPITAWRSKFANDSGRYPLVFRESLGEDGSRLEIPCGKCARCRLEKSRQWAMRCVHEASMYDDNCFITLTYNNENLPSDYGLHKDHLQKFWKRLRKKFPERKIRYYACGEYGEDDSQHNSIGRPHFHACVFNLDLPDKELWTIRDDVRLYRSSILEKVWGKGYCTIGDVTFESAAYVARYVMKKQNGDRADGYYERVDFNTGECHEIQPEFNTMSRRPGIGATWWKEFKKDTDKDFVTINGKKMKPPKFYDKLLEKHFTEEYEELVDKRCEIGLQFAADNTYQRLAAKEKLTEKRIKKLKRGYENEN